MSGNTERSDPSRISAALQTLQTLNIAFRGPFITPKEQSIYFVDGCIVTESEIVALHERGKFTTESIGKLPSDIRSLQASEPLPIDAELAAGNQRRSQRVMLRLDVLARWETGDGHVRQMHAFTVVVNSHGGSLESPFRMTAGQSITLINPQTGKEVACRLVSVRTASEGYFVAAFEFEQQSPEFWAISFPSLADAGEA